MTAAASTPSFATRRSAPLREPAVWWGAAKVAAPIALLQVAINQGDVWLAGHVTGLVLAKSLLSPLVTYTVALLSAANACRSRAS